MAEIILTDVEKQILEIVRTLAPFEEIRIVKDQTGKPDYFVVHRSQKIVITKEKFVAVR